MTLLVGRKAICQFLGGVSWATVKRWIHLKDLPVVQEKGEAPTLLTTHLADWQLQRWKKIKNDEC